MVTRTTLIRSPERGRNLAISAAFVLVGAALGCSTGLAVSGGDSADSPASVTAAVCGDGLWQPGDGTEQCDDGNTEDGDGCSAACQVEEGWECQTALDLHTGTATAESTDLEARWRFPDLLPELPPLIDGPERCPDQPFEAVEPPDGGTCAYIRRPDCGLGVVATFSFNLVELPPRSTVLVAGRFHLPRASTADAGDGVDGEEDGGDGTEETRDARWGIGNLKLNGIIDDLPNYDTVVNITSELRVGQNHLQFHQPKAVAFRVCQPDGTEAWRSASASICQTVCGNGMIDPGEACDGGNRDAGDGCSPECRVEEGYCLLDGSLTANGEWCFAGLSAGCQDGLVECDEAGEAVCRARLPTEEVCNGTDDDCDGEADELAGGPCTVDGAFGPCQIGLDTCVDGALTCVAPEPAAETCNAVDDDCNGLTDDLAAGPCELAAEEDPGCGVGRTQCVGDAPACVAVPSEEVCNGRDDDCDQSVDEECVAACGNGQLDAGEDCDGSPDCTPECQLGYCGDGVVTEGEDCDAGPGGDSGKTCTSDCHYIECGDGIVYSGVEACDDGSTGGEDDGCLACVVTAGWSCDSTIGETSVCSAVCGDGKIVGPETCDDDNDDDGDGCSSSCTGELGFDCATSLLGVNVCEPICGDGVVVNGEGCDDDDEASGDGCSPLCQVEPDWTCSTTGGASVCQRRCDAPGADECPPGAVCDSVTGACAPL